MRNDSETGSRINSNNKFQIWNINENRRKNNVHGFVEKAGAQKDKVDMNNAWHQYDVNDWKSEKCFRSFAMFHVYHHCGLLSSLLYRFSLLRNCEKENYSLLMGYLLLCTQHTQHTQHTHIHVLICFNNHRRVARRVFVGLCCMLDAIHELINSFIFDLLFCGFY